MLVEVFFLDLQGIEGLAPQPVGAAQEHTALGVRDHPVLVRSPTQGVGVPPPVPVGIRHARVTGLVS